MVCLLCTGSRFRRRMKRSVRGCAFAIAFLLVVNLTAQFIQADERSDVAAERIRSLAGQALGQLREFDDQAAVTLGEIADLAPSLAVAADAGLPPVAGAWNRRLDRLRTTERFDLLYDWSMPPPANRQTQAAGKRTPTVERRHIRVLTSLVPGQAPPHEFARAVGERPRSRSFTIAEVNSVRGLFSTGWLLVQAARETGRLNSLIKELTSLAEQQVVGADSLLLLLARVCAADEADDELLAELRSRVDILYGKATVAGELKVPDGQVW